MVLYRNQLTILPEWIDYNGHMNVAYYVLAFDNATDALYDKLGLGQKHIQRTGCSIFTVGMDVDYLNEVFEGDKVTITTQLLDWDYKRVHYYHRMINTTTGVLAAVNECLAMNIHLEKRRSSPFPDVVQAELARVMERHSLLERPDKAMRRLGIKRNSSGLS